MTVQRSRSWMMLVVGIALAGAMGCRDHYPHSFVFGTGEVQRTHAKPVEGGYYSDWDPYAATLEVTPMEQTNPVGTQHVLVATVKDEDGEPLPNRRVEWMIAPGSVGTIVEVDESGWRASRGHKLTNTYAVSHTNNFDHTLTRGNDDPSDDVDLVAGQTWCVITSPTEGDTHVIAYAPGIYNWDEHKVVARKHWHDASWQFPPDATNPVGTPHKLTTEVMRHSDDAPLADYVVNYKIVSGPPAMFASSEEQTVSVRTDDAGHASAELVQLEPAEGTNEIEIDIVRPANADCCKPAANVATGHTTKTWIGAELDITKSAPSRGRVDTPFDYAIEIHNPSDVDARDVVVTDELPEGLEYVSSSPQAERDGRMLTWNVETLSAQASKSMSVRVRPTETGTFNNCAEVTAPRLSDRDCAETVVVAPNVTVEKTGPAEALVCEPIDYRIVVRNTGDGDASGVRITDELPEGMETTDGRRSLNWNIGTLPAGESRRGEFQARVSETGDYTNTAVVTGDGDLRIEDSAQTTVSEPVLDVTKEGPQTRLVGRTLTYTITVTNNGDADARNLQVVDTLPSGTTFSEASHNGSYANGKVTWELGTLEVGDSVEVTVTCEGAEKGDFTNTVTASATCAEGSAEASTEVQGIPAILLEAVDTDDPVEVGETVTYDVTVTNQGSAVGTDIVIVCKLPDELEFVSADGPTGDTVDGQTITFDTIESLEAGGELHYNIRARGLEPGDVRFHVSLTSDQLTSPVEETEATYIYSED
ncbi:MAG: DUF7507 domain-containing protein [Planctomycetota bacterium]